MTGGDTTVIRKPPRQDEGSGFSAYLIVLSGSASGRIFKVGDSKLTIGRHAGCDVRLDDDGVSRRHARIIRGPDGRVTLGDLESTNGTYVNGAQIDNQWLHDGDRIQIGSTTILKFSYQDSLEEQFQKQLYESATRDALTGAYNRRVFDEQLSKEVAYATRHEQPLSLLVFDIDFFKKINDTHGHAGGDAVLASLGKMVAEKVRDEDIFCRIGGEEFAVIMRRCTPEHAPVLAERLRADIAEAHFEHDSVVIPVRISAGVATFDPEKHDGARALYEHADKNLYQAKGSGRNRVQA